MNFSGWDEILRVVKANIGEYYCSSRRESAIKRILYVELSLLRISPVPGLRNLNRPRRNRLELCPKL
jgi:hypothetical protein